MTLLYDLAFISWSSYRGCKSSFTTTAQSEIQLWHEMSRAKSKQLNLQMWGC